MASKYKLNPQDQKSLSQFQSVMGKISARDFDGWLDDVFSGDQGRFSGKLVKKDTLYSYEVGSHELSVEWDADRIYVTVKYHDPSGDYEKWVQIENNQFYKNSKGEMEKAVDHLRTEWDRNRWRPARESKERGFGGSRPMIEKINRFLRDEVWEMMEDIELDEAMWSAKVKTKWEPPEGFFKQSADKIASGLKKASKDLKTSMSRLNFYINRAGANLSDADMERLETAKKKLQKAYS